MTKQDKIEYKIWDKKRNCFRHLNDSKFGIQLFSSGFEVSTGWDSYDNATFGSHSNEGEEIMTEEEYQELQNNFIFLQYTGLKDKNGKKIYKGDIVKHFKLSDHEKLEPIIGEVFITPTQGVIAGLWPLSELGNPEVIGNIYENKDLLTKRDEN